MDVWSTYICICHRSNRARIIGNHLRCYLGVGTSLGTGYVHSDRSGYAVDRGTTCN